MTAKKSKCIVADYLAQRRPECPAIVAQSTEDILEWFTKIVGFTKRRR